MQSGYDFVSALKICFVHNFKRKCDISRYSDQNFLMVLCRLKTCMCFEMKKNQ